MASHFVHIMHDMTSGSKPNPTTPLVDHEEMRLTILRAWEEGLFTQKQASDALDIDQGQVSRIIQGQFRKTTGHAQRLFAYAKEKLDASSGGPKKATDEIPALRKVLVGRLLAAWDQTPAGAEALISLLDAVVQLRQPNIATARRKSAPD